MKTKTHLILAAMLMAACVLCVAVVPGLAQPIRNSQLEIHTFALGQTISWNGFTMTKVRNITPQIDAHGGRTLVPEEIELWQSQGGELWSPTLLCIQGKEPLRFNLMIDPCLPHQGQKPQPAEQDVSVHRKSDSPFLKCAARAARATNHAARAIPFNAPRTIHHA